MSDIVQVRIKEIDLTLKTNQDVFSPSGIDRGTLAMLSIIEFETNDKVLDLGCGYGVVGILAAKMIGPRNVVMTDHNIAAVKLAKENTVLNSVPKVLVYHSDGFRQLSETGFTKILSNPPYHADFSVAKHFIEKGFNRLVIGGRLYMVTKRQEWYKNKLRAIFGGVWIQEIDGYYVFCAEKRAALYANKKLKHKKARGGER